MTPPPEPSGASRPAEPPMVHTLGYRLIRAAGLVHQHFARTLATCGLSPLQHATLAWIDAGGPLHQKALAAAVGVDPGDLVKHLDVLQERGLVVRERDRADRRRQLVSLTDEGAELLGRADRLLAEAESRCFADLPQRSRSRLASDLRRVHDPAGDAAGTPESYDVVGGRSALRAGHEMR